MKIKEQERNLQIDVLRGLSILAILFCHFYQFYSSSQHKVGNQLLGNLGTIAPRGVQVFFIVSAISLNLNTSILNAKSTKKWYFARVLRIYPIWLIAVLTTAVLNQSLGFERVALSSLLSSSTFVFGFNRGYPIPEIIIGGWSLFCEITFYCIFPFLVRRLATPYKAALFYLICLLVRYAWLKTANILNVSNFNEFRELFPLAQVHAFALGHLIYVLLRKYQPSLNRIARAVAITFGLFGIWTIRFDNGIATLVIGIAIFFYLSGTSPTTMQSRVQCSVQKSTYFLAACLSFFGKRTYTYYLYEFLMLDLFALLLTHWNLPYLNVFLIAFTQFLFFTVFVLAIPYRLERLVSMLRKRLL